MPLKIHDLKVAPAFYRELEALRKTSEYRLNDRDFKVGDVLRLKEWFPPSGETNSHLREVHGYTGRIIHREITHVLTHDDFEPVPEDWVILSLQEVDDPDKKGENVLSANFITQGDIDPRLVLKGAAARLRSHHSPLREAVVLGWCGSKDEPYFYYASSVGNGKACLLLHRGLHEIMVQTEAGEFGGSRYQMSDNNHIKPDPDPE